MRKMLSDEKISFFTILELLLVISIIAVLMSILLPALKKAQASAMQMTCASNCKQFGEGVAMYSSDNNSWLPIASLPGGGVGLWKCEISEYAIAKDVGTEVKNASLCSGIFSCPSFKENATITNNNCKGGYGWNHSYFGYYEGATFNRGRKRQQNTSIPSESALCGDGTDWSDSGEPQYAYLYPPSATASISIPVGNRHRNGINVLWADLHAEWKMQKELLSGKNNIQDYFYKQTR